MCYKPIITCLFTAYKCWTGGQSEELPKQISQSGAPNPDWLAMTLYRFFQCLLTVSGDNYTVTDQKRRPCCLLKVS